MKYLNLTFHSPEENLACDEALLNACENGSSDSEILRFWEPKQYFIVLGYSNQAELEVNEPAAKKLGIPILRRVSGGGTVLQGPGCLNYSLILKISRAKELSNLVKTNYYILSRHQECVRQLLNQPVEVQGVSDLTIGNLKFSGNAQRRKKEFLLYHGTFLINFNLGLIEKVLHLPTRQPDYRTNRRHMDFLTNIPISKKILMNKIKKAWLAPDQ